MAPASFANAGESSAPLIVCAGIAVLDHAFQIDRFPEPGSKTRSNRFTAISGGCAANAAIAIARLGARAKLAAPLGGPAGDDVAGDSILALLGRERIDTTAVVRHDNGPSPISAILIDKTGERIIVNYRDPALTSLRCADPDRLLQGASALLIDNRFPEFVLPLAEAARQRGLIVLMDADEPTRETRSLLSTCSHVVFSAEGLRATAQSDEFASALPLVARLTDAQLAVTDGPDGTYWLDGATLRHRPAYRIKALDTLGAGDVFHGACTLALAEGQPFEQALGFASATAAIKCTRFGGIAGAPSRTEVEEFMARTAAG